MSIETQRPDTAPRGERKLTFVIDDDTLFNGDRSDKPQEQGNFLELATALAQRKWFILKMTAAAAVIGLVVALLISNRYTANTKILPPQQQQSSAAAMLSSLSGSSVGALASAAGKDLLKNPNDLYIGMLKTRPVTDAIIKRFDLQKVYGAKDVYAARKDLADHTEIVSEKEGFISIAVEDKQKKRAAEMANAYVEELRNLNKGLAITEASQRRMFYEQQLGQAKEDLATAEVALKLAMQKSGVIQLDAQAKTMIENVGKLRAEIAVKEARLQAVRSFATDQNAEVEMLQSELASLRSELRKQVKQGGGSDDYEVALRDVPAVGVEYVRAERDVKYRNAMFEILARQYEAARIDEAKDSPLIQVIEPAIEPERKSSPKRALIIILCVVSGLFFGCIFALASKWRAQAYESPELAERLNALRAAALGR
jgi:capsule polysaccharide export protein KpsE/RkpR